MVNNGIRELLRKGDKVGIITGDERTAAMRSDSTPHLKTGRISGCCSLPSVPPQDKLYSVRLDIGYTKPSFYSPDVVDTKYVAIVCRSSLVLLDDDYIAPAYTAKKCFSCGSRCFSSLSPLIILDTDGVVICEHCSDKFRLSTKDGRVIADE